MSRSACSRIACTTARVAVPEAVDGQAGLEVEVLVALVVPQPRALAADELDAHPRVGGDEVVALEGLEVGEGHTAGLILVPMPASVKSSSSSECGTRPSTMWAKVTPP